MANDSLLQVELGLRGAIIAKQALELLTISPGFARIQLAEIVKLVKETDDFLTKKGK
jgi:hypothetical protein